MSAQIGQDINKETIDDLIGATRSNRLEMSHLFEGILPKSDRIRDHIGFFRSIDSEAVRTRANHKDYIYFSFPYERLRAFRGAHFVRGDVLVIRYQTSDLSEDATILSLNAILVNGDII